MNICNGVELPLLQSDGCMRVRASAHSTPLACQKTHFVLHAAQPNLSRGCALGVLRRNSVRVLAGAAVVRKNLLVPYFSLTFSLPLVRRVLLHPRRLSSTRTTLKDTGLCAAGVLRAVGRRPHIRYSRIAVYPYRARTSYPPFYAHTHYTNRAQLCILSSLSLSQ